MKPSRPPDRPPEPTIVIIRPGLQISQTCLQVGRRHFTLTDLDNVHTRQTGHDPLTRRAAALLLGGALLLGIFAPLMRVSGIIAAVLVLAGLAALTAFSSRRRPRKLELWANYHGHPVQLFVSDDWWLFGGVERNLKRSLTELRLGHLSAHHGTATSVVPHPSTMHPADLRSGNRSGWERAA